MINLINKINLLLCIKYLSALSFSSLFASKQASKQSYYSSSGSSYDCSKSRKT
nr:MAG TPA: hypothetical protein [Caudoviricetes sp.]